MTPEPAPHNNSDFDPNEMTAPTELDADIAAAEADYEAADPNDPAVRIGALEDQLLDLKDKSLRALAEAENTRRRAQKDREEIAKFGIMEFARELLMIADNFVLALGAISPEARGKDPAIDNVVAGIEMTERQLQQTFERFNIRKFSPVDAMVDPNLHEVFMQMENTGKPPGTIVQVIQPGYTIHDRLLRPARVAVAKGELETKKVDTVV